MTATAAAALAACSGGGDNGGTTQPTPAISIALSASTLSVQQGSNGTVNLTLTRTGGFTGDVTLSFDGLPANVTAAAAPATIGASATSSVITFTAAANATAATTNVTVRAAGTGVTTQTATVALTVTAAPAPTFSLAAAPTAVTVTQGGNGTSTITLTRSGGFTGNVALAADGLPNGVTATFNPTSFTGATTTSTVTFAATATATTGNATVTIRGTATGQTDKTATITLTVNAATAGNYTLAMNPATLTVQQGANGTSTVNITRTGGFAGTVNLTASGLPNGVTAAFNPAAATGNTSTLTLTASATAAVGQATVTIKGTATGLTDQTTTLALTVNAAPAGGYTLSLNPTSLSVAQGANGTTTVTINRTNGFAGAVTLSASGLPNGVTAAFNPTAPTTNSSTLTLTASATAAVGQATVTIKGTATGLTDQTTTLTLNVTASSGGSGNTTWEFCTVAQTPIWMAVQDGANGTWTRVTPTGTKFQFNITQAKGGIAYVTTNAAGGVATASRSLAVRLSAALEKDLLLANRPTRGNAYAAASSAVETFALNIYYGTQAELNSVGTSRCLPGTGKTVNGTVAGVTASASGTQSAIISLGPSVASASASSPAFQLTDVPDGNLDLVASRSTLAINGTSFSSTLDKLIIRRGVNAANNSTLPVLDFGSAEAFDPVQANLTVGNLGADIAYVTSAYYTNSGSSIAGAALSTFPTPGAGPFKYYGVPVAKQAAGDLHVAIAFALPSLTATDQLRFAALFFKDPTDRTVTLGPALNAPAVSVVATAPYVRLRATAATQAQYNQAIAISFSQANATLSRSVSISASQGYLAGSGTYDFTIPDFTGTAGWDNNWGLKTGLQTTWSATGYAFTGISLLTGTPVEGATYTGASRNGTITP